MYRRNHIKRKALRYVKTLKYQGPERRALEIKRMKEEVMEAIECGKRIITQMKRCSPQPPCWTKPTPARTKMCILRTSSPQVRPWRWWQAFHRKEVSRRTTSRATRSTQKPSSSIFCRSSRPRVLRNSRSSQTTAVSITSRLSRSLHRRTRSRLSSWWLMAPSSTPSRGSGLRSSCCSRSSG